MPEYLAPAVYVEEVDTGSKPIEGVSTSTAGMIGVTERGPVGVPILVTSFGEYQRWFGQMLSPDLYGDHRFLPHSVEGFFTNGGKRVFVTRVLAAGAGVNSATALYGHVDGGTEATLLTRSPANSGNLLFVWPGAAGTINANDEVRVGMGTDAEYGRATAAPAAATTAVVTGLPLQRTHALAANKLEHYAALPGGATLRTLVGDHAAGATAVSISGGGGVVVDRLLQIQRADGSNEELIYIRGAVDLGGGNWRVELDTPLQLDHANAEQVNVQAALPAPLPADITDLTRAAVGGDSILLATASGVFTAMHVVRVVEGTRGEVRRVGAVSSMTLGAPLTFGVPAGSYVEHVTRADAGTLKSLEAPVAAGSMTFTVTDRAALAINDTIRIGAVTDPDVEYATITDLPNRAAAGPDPGRIVLSAPLARAHGGATAPSLAIVQQQTITTVAPAAPVPHAGTVTHDVGAGSDILLLNGTLLGVPATNNDLARISLPSGDLLFARIGAVAARPIQQLNLTAPLLQPHAAPVTVAPRVRLLDVTALDPGVWGDRLRASVRRETAPLARTRIRNDASGIQSPVSIRLESLGGVELGTILRLADAQGQPTDTPFKVIALDRANGNLLTLDTPLPAAAMTGSAVVSIEFSITVYLLRQEDQSQPTRNAQVLDLETFRHLSLDPRHSRYVQRVIGTPWAAGANADLDGRPLRRADRRSEGESSYIRVRDVAQDMIEPNRTNTLNSIRLGPEFLWDTLQDGRREAARRALRGGGDQINLIVDADYAGIDDPNPERRSGLSSLRNYEEISIVAAPGCTGAQVQGALISHCELMRYRFAVLDAAPPPLDSLNDVQAQRQQFDTKYAALYHPWLTIPHPFPPGPGSVPDYPIPPAGHMVGIYARTDIERGVHKAPANEVVRGVGGLQRILNKEQHDILNPYPVNINVIRDFRPNNRGIRVYGGRCITSDSDWKYVNVRRLMIFIEASVDRGLQWVVFEPNAEPLWARVRRSVSNFLTLLWRNGALEGTKPEEAYFVKCDRTTMTQTDIDQGRLICLVGVAPVKPAEFVIVRIGLWTAHADE
jgi:hypothetical protein